MRRAGSGRLLIFLEGAGGGDACLFCDGLTVATGLGRGCAEAGADLDLERSVRFEPDEPSDNLDGPAIGDASLSGDANRSTVGSDWSEPDPDCDL